MKKPLAWSRYNPLLLLGLTLAMFGDVLFASRRVVLSQWGTDLSQQFLMWRAFGFGHMRQGHFPLWNPHVFSGTPFFAGFQSALLYPINWIHLFLPLDKAVNLEIAVHVFLTGLGMYWWALQQKLQRSACLTAAVLWMFGAPYFLKIFAGHLAPLAAMCWIPWLLLAVDLAFDGLHRRGMALGVLAGAMQLLAGHPQTAYNTAVAIALYAGLRLTRASHRGRVVATLGIIGVGAALLSAVQILAGLSMIGESSRAQTTPDFVRFFSLPPENLLTLLAPNLLGAATMTDNGAVLPYWGRWYLWEVSLFMGVTGLMLAVQAVLSAPRATVRYWVPLLALWLVAISASTPLFDIFYHALPGFNKFRGHSKLLVPAAAFACMLSAVGLDALQAGARRLHAMTAVLFVFALLSAVLGLWLHGAGNSALWQHLVKAMAATRASSVSGVAASPIFMTRAATTASAQLLTCGGVCLLLGVLWLARARFPKATYFIAAVAMAEVLVFAFTNRPSFPLEKSRPSELAGLPRQALSADRVLNIDRGNNAMMADAYDIWGYDPLVLGRYAEFMAWSQGTAPGKNGPEVPFRSYNRLYRMLRCRYVILPAAQGNEAGRAASDVLPHVLLVGEYSVAAGREAIFAALGRKDFDPQRHVILEEQPEPRPSGDVEGNARVVEEGTDYLVIEAQTKRPAILLVTDSYAKDWKAHSALGAGAQQEYSVLPANYVLRAIPLRAGRHRLRLEYSPRNFVIGKWISMLALVLYLGAVGFFCRARFKASRAAG